MKTKLLSLRVLAPALALAITATAIAAPIGFDEVSLLVRMRDGDAYILQQVKTRGLLRAFSPQQEARLKAEGASEKLVATLRTPDLILPAEEATAFEQARERRRLAIQQQAEQEEAARVAAAQAAAAEAKAQLAAQQAEEEAAARRAALAPKMIPVAPGDIDYNDFATYGTPYPPAAYLGEARPADPNRFLHDRRNGPNNLRPIPSGPGGPTHIQAGSARQVPVAPVSPIHPTPPTGSGDRNVTPLSSNATFVPLSGRGF